MVDFSKKLAAKHLQKLLSPVALYETLDRAHDKGPLRPVQTAILNEWHEQRRKTKDTVIKLHTGQGKTRALSRLTLSQARWPKVLRFTAPSNHLCIAPYSRCFLSVKSIRSLTVMDERRAS
jgi:hypothetical protein